MRSLQVLLTSTVAGLALLATSCRRSSSETDELAVAGAYGQLLGFLLSTNYAAAYEMMSSEFKKTHSLTVFRARDEHYALQRTFADCDLNAGATVHLTGVDAELRIKYNVSFGRAYVFRKEDGRWRYTDKASDFEVLWP